MRKLTEAIMLAAKVHDGQHDKAGEPYILHPLRVMLAMETETQRIVAILHDTVEDSDDVSLDDIATAFGEEVRDAVDAMTRRDGEAYLDFVARAKQNPVARRVKLADVADNLSQARAASLPERLKERYLAARTILED